MPTDLPNLEVLYEDNHLIAVNKRAGDIVQGDKTGDTPLSEKVAEYLRIKYHKPGKAFVGVIHRLDRPVSGVVVFAKTSKALARMNALFARKEEVTKRYHAIVEQAPTPPQGALHHWLRKNAKQNKSYPTAPHAKGAKEALLEYRTLGIGDRYTLLEVTLLTGRHHQIRAQLSAAGAIIRGDLKYGARRSLPDGSISLHARRLTFVHPVSKEVVDLVAPYPQGSLFSRLTTDGDVSLD